MELLNPKYYLLAFNCALVAYVYSTMLTEPGMILSGWYKFLERTIGKYDWLFKPVIDCFKCVAGQLSLWIFLYLLWDLYCQITGVIPALKVLFTHVHFIFLTIILSWIIDRLRGH